jgi:hypothetical protein
MRVIELGIHDQQPLAVGHDLTPELWRCVVEDDEIDLTPDRSLETADETKTYVESISGSGIEGAIEEQGEIDVALPVRPRFGRAAEQVGRNETVYRPTRRESRLP